MAEPCLPPVGTIESQINKSLQSRWGQRGSALSIFTCQREKFTLSLQPCTNTTFPFSLDSNIHYRQGWLKLSFFSPLKPLSLNLAAPPPPPTPSPLIAPDRLEYKETISVLLFLPGLFSVSSSFCINLQPLAKCSPKPGQIWFVLWHNTKVTKSFMYVYQKA